MKRLLAVAAIIAACATFTPAAALPLVPVDAGIAAEAGGLLEVKKGGRGHGRHMGRGGRGHHHGWHRGRGHHYGWYKGRGRHYGWSRGRHRGW